MKLTDFKYKNLVLCDINNMLPELKNDATLITNDVNSNNCSYYAKNFGAVVSFLEKQMAEADAIFMTGIKIPSVKSLKKLINLNDIKVVFYQIPLSGLNYRFFDKEIKGSCSAIDFIELLSCFVSKDKLFYLTDESNLYLTMRR